MEKISRVSIGVFVVFLLLPPWAHALEVGMARLQDGEVRVMGKSVQRDASIYWQGVTVTTSTGGGSFSFTSSNVPTTCVGKLSDGVTTLFIAVSGCTASGVTIPSTVALVAAPVRRPFTPLATKKNRSHLLCRHGRMRSRWVWRDSRMAKCG